MTRWALVALAVIATVTAFAAPAISAPPPTRIVSVSLPGLQLAPEERIVGFHLDVTSGRIAQLPAVPIGWNVSVENDPSWNTTLDASVIVAAAALDKSFFKHFVLIDKHEGATNPFELSGEIVVSKDFSSTRTILLATKDFTLKETTISER